MNILITAPSLNVSKNISGISSMVNNIIINNQEHLYFHFLLGRPDHVNNRFTWLVLLVKQLIRFPFFLSQNKIELVHQNLPFDPKGLIREFVINCWCRLAHVPIILHIHGGVFILQGTQNILFKKLACWLFKYSKQVIVLSHSEKQLLHEKFNFPDGKVLSNGINLSEFNTEPLKISKDPPNFLYLGRLEKNKGIIELTEAIRLLRTDFNFRFVLCGTGSLVDFCINEFTKILGNDFEYRGIVSGEIKSKILNESHYFILPSYFEGIPMALLETMGAGVVPIVTRVGSMKHIVKEGINGYLVNKQDTQDLYEKLKAILKDQSNFERLSENAKETIANKYDLKEYMIQLNLIYNSAMDSKNKFSVQNQKPLVHRTDQI